MHRIVDPIRVFFQLMTRVKKGDLILSYHNMSFQKILFFVKKIKKCKLILEVEEIYGMVYQDRSTVNKEMHRFRKADAFIFPTRLLGERINTKNKPAVIAHGSYDVPKIVDWQRKDRLIHCVYAGTFNPKKGGAEIAVGAARFLSDKYHVHIIGFGSPEETKAVLDQIESVQKEAACRITYDGLKTGKEYIDFLQNCDVGLSTQNPDAPFNATSFPSKILSYMAAGLRVVTARIPVVETSAIGEHLYYYEQSDSEMIAKAIESIDYSEKYDSRLLIRKLDESFKTDLSKLIRAVSNKKNNV